MATEWFYASNGQQTGPLSDAQLDELAKTGAIAPATLVWRQGLDQWKPYSDARKPSATTAIPPLLDHVLCAECRRPFSRNDVLRYENVHVCGECKPAFFQRVREGVGLAGIGAWRSGKLLVVRIDANLPDRCVKCNAATNGRKLVRSLTWHTPWVYLLLFAGVVPYVVVAMAMSKKAKIAIGVCKEHNSIRNRDIAIGWLGFALFIGSFFVSSFINSGWFILGGLGLFLAALIYAVLRTPLVTPKKIDERHVWLNGAAPAFVEQFPEFPGNP
jgi:hypothetical protein